MPSPTPRDDRHLLNWVVCPQCQQLVDDRAPACPNCGTKIYVEHPADITPTRNEPESGVGQTNLRKRAD